MLWLVGVLALAVVLAHWETIRINWIVWLTVNRGILTVNPFWWRVNDLFSDSSGVALYQQLQRRGPFVPTNIFGTRVLIVTDVAAIMEILDGSPQPFGVGALKYAFFEPFMRLNVGVSEGCPWRRRRRLNEAVLDPTKAAPPLPPLPPLAALPTCFAAFSDLGRRIATLIVFGEGAPVCPAVFDIFAEANSIASVVFGGRPFGAWTPSALAAYTAYVRHYIRHPIPGSLIAAALPAGQPPADDEELLHQVPHWVFPLNGLIAVAAPRLLALLLNHPRVLAGVRREYSPAYLRACALELFRLNNPVNSTFRTLREPYTFRCCRQPAFEAGTQFLVLNNPVNRDPAGFDHPNRFIPERWTAALEASPYALMFNQGPQRCPGKELAIALLTAFVTQVLRAVPPGASLTTNLAVDPAYVPQMINPVTLRFTCAATAGDSPAQTRRRPQPSPP